MSKFTFASEAVKTLTLSEGATLTVREELSRKDYNNLLRGLPSDYDAEKGLTLSNAGDWMSSLFGALVTDWSLGRPATVENYLALTNDASQEVDVAIAEHFNSLAPEKEERTKSKGTSK